MRPASGASPWGHVPPSVVPPLPSTKKQEGFVIWAKIDDKYFSNRKILRLTGPARFLHLTSLIWAAGNSEGTGVVPKPVLPQLAQLAGIPARVLADASALLVEVGLWEDHGDEWAIHDFVPFTPPKKQAENAERLAAWRAVKDGRKTGERQVKDSPGVDERQGQPRPVPDPYPTRPVPDPYPTLIEALQLCELLVILMTQNGCKVPDPIPDAWLDDMDRMLRLDNRIPEQVEQVIRWSQQDPFWKTNIHSPGKLRQQYDKLRLKMETPAPANRALTAGRAWLDIADRMKAAGQ